MESIKSKIMPVIILIIFVVIMNTGGLLKKPFSKNDDVFKCIENIKEDVEEENWEKAADDLVKLRNSWKKVGRRVQFSVERNEMLEMDNTIARLEGAIWAKDKSASLIEIGGFMGHWMNLEK